MESTRRSFLRSILFGAAGVVAAPIIKPKTFFSMFGAGELYKPAPGIVRVTWYTYPTLADWAKRMDARRPQTAKIAEPLNQSNPILDDIAWVEGNIPGNNWRPTI